MALSPFVAVGQDLDIASINISDEICGNGIDDSASGYTEGSCPVGWTDAVYSDGCDLLCPGIDQDQDGFYSEDSGTRTETATVNGNQNSVNTITVDSGHSIREGMFVDVASPARRVSSWTSTTITVRGAAVNVTDNQTIEAVDAIDCDDTDRDIIPGEAYPCDAGGGATSGYKYCLASGSYGSCTSKSSTPFCPESPGNDATCWYISAASGSDTTGDGSHGNPWATLGKVSGGSSGSEPSGARTLAAGDAVVLLGDTNFTTSFTKGSDTIMADFGGAADGTALQPIIITRDPGATARIVNTNGHGLAADGIAFLEFRNLEVTVDTGGSGDAIGILTHNEDDRNFIRIKAYDTEMNGDNNNNCIYSAGTNRTRIHNSFLWDCKRGSGEGNVNNVGGVMWLDNDASSVGAGHMIETTVMGSDSYDDTNGPTCIRMKHGPSASDVGADGHIVRRNFFVNCRQNIYWDGSSLRMTDNIIFGGSGATSTDYGSRVTFIASGESNAMEDNEISYNVLLDVGTFTFNPSYNTNDEEVNWNYNIIIDPRTSFYDNSGVYRMANGDASARTTFETNTYLFSNNNCFYNPSGNVRFCYFPSGGGSCTYNFTSWQGLSAGYDASSFEVDPDFDEYHRAQEANCDDKGKRYVMSGAVASTSGPARGTFIRR